jgi:RNA polymerase primary sigma factor
MEDHDSNDRVAMYVRELSGIQPLTKHEETSLFRELAGATGTKQGESIERRLIESHLSLVVSIAEKYSASGVAMLDLIQEGNIGLMKSVKSFAETPSGDFAAYAAACVEAAIAKTLGK